MKTSPLGPARPRLMAGNWKMNHLAADIPSYLDEMEAASQGAGVEAWLAVPYTLLTSAAAHCHPRGLSILGQNVHARESGAYTGEISIPMLRETGARGAIVGHSERRQYYGESSEAVAAKAAALQRARMFAVVCIGETQDERDQDHTKEVLTQQLQPVFAALPSIDHVVLAYEPVWAIGTGRTATTSQAQEVHHFIRGLVRDRYGSPPADALRILYGGSVKGDNVEDLVACPDIDGGLVGGASLRGREFGELLRLIG